MLGITPSCGEAVEVGVVDQLRVRDHRPPVARPVGADGMLDRVQRLARGRIADRVDVDLEPEFVDTARAALGEVASHTCMPWLCSEPQYGASSAPVSFSMTPSAKNLTVLAVSSGDATSCDAPTRVGELLELSVEVARVGVEAEVEPHVERVLPGGRRGRCRRRPARPTRPAPRSRRAPGSSRRRCRALRRATAGSRSGTTLVHQVDGAPLTQRAQR